ncbi:MAG: VOC family protein [bacterium]
MPNGSFLCQVALVALDGTRLRRWYQEVFGFLPSGGTVFAGPLTTRVQGIPRVASVCRWLLDSKDLFQMEFFQYWSPKSKPRRPDWKPSDIGYSMFGLHTADFSRTLENLARLGARPLSEPVGGQGDRRVCVRDPEGNLVEILEKDPLAGLAPPGLRPEVPVTVRTVTVSVPDLEAARRVWQETFGLAEAVGIRLHGPEHEAMRGLGGAERKSLLLSAGGMLVELVEYTRPAGRPWPEGYRICDQGIMNVAFGFRSRAAFEAQFWRAVQDGCRPNGIPVDIGVFKVMYVNDPAKLSIELLYPRPWALRLTGFEPPLSLKRPVRPG